MSDDGLCPIDGCFHDAGSICDACYARLTAERDAAKGTVAELLELDWMALASAHRMFDRIKRLTAERDAALALLHAIHQAARTDERSEWWTLRQWLADHDVYHDNISSLERLIEIAHTAFLKETP